ncbi:hypothetical protein [Pyrobaculum aerophilum]|nr:hypothetical protein [Pyrobaculum aerophilum]
MPLAMGYIPQRAAQRPRPAPAKEATRRVNSQKGRAKQSWKGARGVEI